MLRGKCKCGNTLKNVKPLPRYPKENNKISEHEHISKKKTEKKKMNRYRWILTKMPDTVSVSQKQLFKNLGGFLPETRRFK
tara:strand:+ start:424 stop:666 length:243 start_codon:yes stop_codon:yes gene_type:complete